MSAYPHGYGGIILRSLPRLPFRLGLLIGQTEFFAVDKRDGGRTMERMKPLFLPLLSAAALLLLSCDGSKEEPAPTAAEPQSIEPAVENAEPPAAEPVLSEEMQALTAAAEGGDAVAQNNLALAYAAGEGVPQDAAHAFELYRQAAGQGNTAAAFNLARCYALGEGTAVDEKAFIEHCTKAAKAGYAPAQYTLGCAYRDGLGVDADPVEAERWLSRAELNGYPKK